MSHYSGLSPDFYNQLQAAAVETFRKTQLGQDFEAEYLHQITNDALTAVDDPLLWLGVGLCAAVLIYVLIK